MSIDLSLLVQLVGPPCGAIVALVTGAVSICRMVMADRAAVRWLAASPADRALLGPIPPSPRLGGGSTAALLLAVVLSIGLPFAQGTAHPLATLVRLGVLSRDEPAAQRPPPCTPDTCPPPAGCTSSGCRGSAAPVQPPATGGPVRAAAKHPPRLDSAILPDPSTLGEDSARGALPRWAFQ